MSTKSKLKLAWEHARTVPGLGRDVSAVIGLIVLGLVVAGVVLAKQRVHWPWQDEFVVAAEFKEVPGVSTKNGQEVRIAGVTVGRISDSEITSEGAARLTLALEPGYDVYENARLILRPKTPLNDMYIEMNPGGPPAEKLDAEDVIPESRTASPVEVDEVLQHLDERTRAALTTLVGESDAALAHADTRLPKGLDATADTLDKLRPVVEALQTRRETIAKLVTSVSQISEATGGDDERLARVVSSLERTLRVVAERDGELEQSLDLLPGLSKDLHSATGTVEGLSGELDPALANLKAASHDLPQALDRLTRVAAQVQDTAALAAPVVRDLRPVVSDLLPFVQNLRPALADAEAVTGRLDKGTGTLTRRLTDVLGFLYNTTSIVSLEDANGGILRGQIQANKTSLPLTKGASR